MITCNHCGCSYPPLGANSNSDYVSVKPSLGPFGITFQFGDGSLPSKSNLAFLPCSSCLGNLHHSGIALKVCILNFVLLECPNCQ